MKFLIIIKLPQNIQILDGIETFSFSSSFSNSHQENLKFPLFSSYIYCIAVIKHLLDEVDEIT